MSRFTQTDEPLGRYLPGGKLFRIEESIHYDVGSEGSGTTITVPRGFVTDFASIPRLAQVLIPKDVGRRAAMIHDWLYATNGLRGFLTRKQADAVFLEAMGVLQVPGPVRWVMWAAVRLGGWVAWRNSRENGFRLDDMP